MNYECNIYTKNNWDIITYLFEGVIKNNNYIVWLDNSSASYNKNITSLKRINPYLAQVIDGYAANNGVIFIKKF